MGQHGLRLSLAGLPELLDENGWKPLDFNRVYFGYYPPCRFTAAVTARDAYYLAGTDEHAAVHLFRSVSGSVWEPVNLAPKEQPETPRHCGDVRTMLENPVDGSLLLVCENGYVLTLPGCPKCVKETHWSEKLIDGRIVGETLELSCESGKIIVISLAAVQQLRTGWIYAADRIKIGGVVIDLRGEDAEPTLAGAIGETLSRAMLHLRQGRYDGKPVFFFCHTGVQADAAALTARKMGFSQVYSLGGIAQIMESNNGIWPNGQEE